MALEKRDFTPAGHFGSVPRKYRVDVNKRFGIILPNNTISIFITLFREFSLRQLLIANDSNGYSER